MEQEEESKTIMLRGLSLHVTEDDVCSQVLLVILMVKLHQKLQVWQSYCSLVCFSTKKQSFVRGWQN